MKNWLTDEPKESWFQSYFSNNDGKWKDERFPDQTSHAPYGPPDSNRQTSNEKSCLIKADPSVLDLHLSYSAGLETGPIIERVGDTSPIMEDPEIPGSYTTDPDLQRIGSYYITEEKKSTHIQKVFYSFAGNYIMHRLIDDVEARKCARDILLSHFPEIAEFESYWNDQNMNIATLTGDVVGFVNPFLQFLKTNNITMPSLFVNQVDHPRLDHDAIDAINELYKPTYPEPVKNFAIYEKAGNFREMIAYNMKKYLRLLTLLIKTPSHEQNAKARKLGDIVLMQGCGDLTMNDWNVAFVSGPSYSKRSNQDNDEWRLLLPRGEPLNDRSYTCLIKWSCQKDNEDLKRIAEKVRIVHPYQIARVRFMVPSLEVGPPNRHVFMGDEPIGHLVEFAVYGQQLYKDGVSVRLQSVVREFGDIRHIYKLPNLNRDEQYKEAIDAGIAEYEAKPRNLFNQTTRDDVWLGESVLKRDRNLRVAGLVQAIQLDIKDLGAPEKWIQTVLEREEKKYHTYNQIDTEVTLPGQWRWISEGRDKLLEIFLIQNQYPSSMIGVRADGEDVQGQQRKEAIVSTKEIFFLAHGHNYDWQNCTIKEAADYLNHQGAWNILLFDEGNDVFQLAANPDGSNLRERVPLKRNQLRCVFWANARGF